MDTAHRGPYGSRELKLVRTGVPESAGNRGPYGSRELKFWKVIFPRIYNTIAARMGRVN